MKAESFFIGPLDENKEVNLNMSLSDLKYIHGILVDSYNQALKLGDVSEQLESLMLNIHGVITSKLEVEENRL
jgi:hypothetical protein